jgi:hypothetical protein
MSWRIRSTDEEVGIHKKNSGVSVMGGMPLKDVESEGREEERVECRRASAHIDSFRSSSSSSRSSGRSSCSSSCAWRAVGVYTQHLCSVVAPSL